MLWNANNSVFKLINTDATLKCLALRIAVRNTISNLQLLTDSKHSVSMTGITLKRWVKQDI